MLPHCLRILALGVVLLLPYACTAVAQDTTGTSAAPVARTTPKDTTIVQGSPPPLRPSLFRYFSRPDFGFSLLFHGLAEGIGGTSNPGPTTNLTALGVSMGLNLPVVYLNDMMTVGISPNLDFSRVLNSVYENVMTLEVPAYLTLKYGTDATWAGANKGFGFAAGVGYRYTLMFGAQETFTFGMPNLMFEVNVGKRRSALGLVKFRYSLSIGTYDYELQYNDGGPSDHILFTNHAFHILLTPGF
jgi:hypothetical protein